MVFIPYFINVVYYTDQFFCAESNLHLWDKSHLVMIRMTIIFYFAGFDFLIFFGEFCVYIHREYWPVFSFLMMSL
jgi:hypothetical protein